MIFSVISLLALISVAMWLAGLPVWESLKIFISWSSIAILGWLLWVAFVYYVFVSPFVEWITS